MADLALRLAATRCLDGVELIHREDYPDNAYPPYGRSGPGWFAYCSERQEAVTRNAVDLGDPLVVRFVNATDDDKRITFLSRFGLPGPALDFAGIGIAEPRNVILGRQRVLRQLLQDAGSGDATRAFKGANESLRFVRFDTRLSLAPDGHMVQSTGELMSFMYMEIALAAKHGAYLASCKRCSDVFLIGKLTRRRSTSKYCSDRCRVGSHQANKRGT
jgi:hypothetical protein